MKNIYHTFHIPVMGTGHSIDTPIRVAHFGIASVISVVDDILIEKIHRYYCEKFNFTFTGISKKDPDCRAKRITAYLNTVNRIVQIKMDELKKQPFFMENGKSKYFEMLPDTSPLKQAYYKLLKITNPVEKAKSEVDLTNMMKPGSIDVNIMSKVDKANFDGFGNILSNEYSDAKAALRGYAKSILSSSVVFSAGFNRGLMSYISQFNDFYRDSAGEIKKKIIVKVSDFRSALIQGKFLASKGLEVSEFRIESGLNCGGHAFASQGHLLPSILDEFSKKKELFIEQLQPIIKNFYKSMGWQFTESAVDAEPLITVQGGIGTSGEAERLINDFNCDATGWGSPFLLVPEATCVDIETMNLLMEAGKEDVYLSNSSPLGVPFNNLRGTGSELWTKGEIERGKPGSGCPKGFLISNSEFTDKPICTASKQFQGLKITQVNKMTGSDAEKAEKQNSIFEKVCLCNHLGNGALLALGIEEKKYAPQAVCPGPNIIWFNREYSLKEMADHIYGRGDSLISDERPHMFCQEIELYVNYFEKLLKTTEMNEAGINYLLGFKENLEKGMDFCDTFASKEPFKNENIKSITPFIELQRRKLRSLSSALPELQQKQHV